METPLSLGNSTREGGGVFLQFGNTVNICESTAFIDNLADLQGAGVFLFSDSNITINGNTKFIDNVELSMVEVFLQCSLTT